MGGCASSDDDPNEVRIQRRRSSRINSSLKKDAEQATAVKLLLLGSGNAGKSTFLKQFKKLYSSGFTDTDRLKYRPVIRQNIVRDILILADAAETLEGVKEEGLTTRGVILVRTLGSISEITCFQKKVAIDAADTKDSKEVLTVFDILNELWEETGIQKAVAHEGKIKDLEGNLRYWFSVLERVAKVDFMPTDDDLLQMRTRTVGVVTFVNISNSCLRCGVSEIHMKLDFASLQAGVYI